MKVYYEKTAAITGESFVFSSELNFDMTCENRYFDGFSGPYLRYTYNPNDERVLKISPAGVTKYITDGNGQVLAEYDGDGNLKYNYIFGNGQKLARVNAAGTKEYLHNDYLGSVRRISDKDGNLVWSRDYYPFGESRQASGANEDNLYTYEGKEKDLEIDLWYNTARFFTDAGRFTQPDPFWAKYTNISPYVRVADNPLRFVDEDGRDVDLASQAFNNPYFTVAYKMYLATPSGRAQFNTLNDNHNVLVKYFVRNMEYHLGQNPPDPGKENGKTVKVVIIDKEYLERGHGTNMINELEEPAITIFHEGEHITGDPEFTGEINTAKTDHERMGYGSDDPNKPLNVFKRDYYKLKEWLNDRTE